MMELEGHIHPKLRVRSTNFPTHRQTGHHPQLIRRPETGEKFGGALRNLVLIVEGGSIEVGEDGVAAGVGESAESSVA